MMLEAIRILQALGVKPRRTIRVALWNGEEGLFLNSLNYVNSTSRCEIRTGIRRAGLLLQHRSGTTTRGAGISGLPACNGLIASSHDDAVAG